MFSVLIFTLCKLFPVAGWFRPAGHIFDTLLSSIRHFICRSLVEMSAVNIYKFMNVFSNLVAFHHCECSSSLYFFKNVFFYFNVLLFISMN